MSAPKCASARGPDADRHAKLLIHRAVEGSTLNAYSHSGGPKPPLLQIEDLVAYVSQRCAGAGYDQIDMKFEALNRIVAAEQITIGIAPDGGIGINVPNTSLAFRGPAKSSYGLTQAHAHDPQRSKSVPSPNLRGLTYAFGPPFGRFIVAAAP